MRVAEDFFGLADLFKENTRLARALTDPARSVEDKRGLVSSAFGAHVTPATRSVVNLVVADHWRRPTDVDDALEVLGILSVLNAAGAKGALDQVREELFQVRYFLDHNREVRVRLSDISTGDSHERGDLATSLFGSRVSVWTMRLVRRAVGRSNHGRLLHNIRRYAQWAATIQDADDAQHFECVIDVSGATPVVGDDKIDDGHRRSCHVGGECFLCEGLLVRQ